jgi:hypothetical protein
MPHHDKDRAVPQTKKSQLEQLPTAKNKPPPPTRPPPPEMVNFLDLSWDFPVNL